MNLFFLIGQCVVIIKIIIYAKIILTTIHIYANGDRYKLL